MIVPQFWAESRRQHRSKGKQVTVRRFGWSDASLGAAQANADQRVENAMARILAGEKLLRYDPKTPYNGAEGVPIREEVLSRHGEAAITRNSYGARCLNTPDVFFADVDDVFVPPKWFSILCFTLFSLAALACAFTLESKLSGVLLVALTMLFAGMVSRMLFGLYIKLNGGFEQLTRIRAQRFLAKHPDWNFRLYRTPAGMRVLATHAPMGASDVGVRQCFSALHVDPVYARMCFNQKCFRARLSAKPWRIGINAHMRPRPGVWPINPEHLPIREAWIRDYEKVAENHAACRYLESIGSGTMHAQVAPIVELHDALCGARSAKPLA